MEGSRPQRSTAGLPIRREKDTVHPLLQTGSSQGTAPPPRHAHRQALPEGRPWQVHRYSRQALHPHAQKPIQLFLAHVSEAQLQDDLQCKVQGQEQRLRIGARLKAG